MTAAVTAEPRIPQQPTAVSRATAQPWPDPWWRQPGARPRSEYWDVSQARWVRSSRVPTPRRGD